MIRLSTIVLFIVLGVAAVGRYRAEVSVRDARAMLQQIEAERLDEARAIQVLRA